MSTRLRSARSAADGPKGQRLKARTLSVIALSALVACTAVVSEDPVQCSTDQDCAARGPDFVDTICSTAGTCVSKPPPPAECTKHSDCASKGADFVCSDLSGTCQKVTSEDCQVAYGKPTEDGTIILGLLSEISRDDTLYFRQNQHLLAAQLAFTEFFEKSGVTLPGGRKAALVACTEHFPRRASAHLANIGVKAIIGPADEGRQKAVIETLLQVKVPSFSPWMNGNPSAVIPESGAVTFFPAFQRPEVVAPVNALLAEIEPRLKAERGTANLRVAVIVNKTATSAYDTYAEYGDLMDQRLIFNGKSAVENERDASCGNCYKRFATSQATLDIVGERAKAIIDFKPDVIIPFADIDWGAQLLPKLELDYAALPGNVNRPVYLHPFLQIEDQGYKSLKVSDASLRRRITGIRPLRDNSFEVFANKFKEFTRPKSAPEKVGPEPNPGAGRAFETTFLLLFASYAALVDDPKAGPQAVVAALPKVTQRGAPTKVTLNDIALGIQRLNAKEAIDLEGLFTFFDFNEKTHAANAIWTTWCVGEKGQYLSQSRIFDGTAFGGSPAFCP
jgi:hypothetical protein